MSNLRSRWSRFCSNIRGAFKIFIASSSNTGVWTANCGKPAETPEPEVPANIIQSTNSLLSARMKDSAVNSFSRDVTPFLFI